MPQRVAASSLLKNAPSPGAARVRMAGAGSCRGRLMGLRERVGHEGCTSDGTCADRRAEQERAARLIMLGHGSLLSWCIVLKRGPDAHSTCGIIIGRVR